MLLVIQVLQKVVLLGLHSLLLLRLLLLLLLLVLQFLLLQHIIFLASLLIEPMHDSSCLLGHLLILRNGPLGSGRLLAERVLAHVFCGLCNGKGACRFGSLELLDRIRDSAPCIVLCSPLLSWHICTGML